MTFCRNITWRKHSRCETFLKSLTLRNMDFVPLPFLVFVNMYSLAGTNIVSRVHEFSFWILWNPLLNQSIAVSPGFWQYSVWFHLLLCSIMALFLCLWWQCVFVSMVHVAAGEEFCHAWAARTCQATEVSGLPFLILYIECQAVENDVVLSISYAWCTLWLEISTYFSSTIYDPSKTQNWIIQ